MATSNGVVLTVLLLSITAIMADNYEHHHSRNDKTFHKKHMADIERRLDALLEMESELENEIEVASSNVRSHTPDETEESEPSAPQQDVDPLEDPCAGVKCSAGRSCVVSETGMGECQCVAACEEETDPRRRVCSNHNETWMTDCDLHRQRCLCTDGLTGCQDEMYKHLHIDYYGQCQDLPECVKTELDDFPRRMKEWLFNVMRDMADRQILSNHYMELEKEAEEDETRKWSNAVVWKWCDLDEHPKDKIVSRHELFPLRAPLYTLEHCIAPFLDSCDPDDDHQITLKEWGNCLNLDAEELEDMDALCEDIRETENQ